jgi:hypothetical protein
MDTTRYDDLNGMTDAEIERLEGRLFCAGGPPARHTLAPAAPDAAPRDGGGTTAPCGPRETARQTAVHV